MSDPSLLKSMLPQSQHPPGKQMQYDGQLVWCLDRSDQVMFAMANDLHGKRFAAGEGTKSEIVYGKNPSWPGSLANSANLRLYVVAHGVRVTNAVPPKVKIDTGGGLTEANVLDAEGFFPMLRDLIHKSPQKRVARISLSMCNSAGIKGTLPVEQSFAKALADRCTGLTTDVVGRQGTVLVRGVHFSKEQMDGIYSPNQSPFYTYMLNGQTMRAVINAKKQVESYPKAATYVIRPNQKPELKKGYSE